MDGKASCYGGLRVAGIFECVLGGVAVGLIVWLGLCGGGCSG